MYTSNNGSPGSIWWRRLHCAKNNFTVTLHIQVTEIVWQWKKIKCGKCKEEEMKKHYKKNEKRTLGGRNKINVILWELFLLFLCFIVAVTFIRMHVEIMAVCPTCRKLRFFRVGCRSHIRVLLVQL